MSQRAQLDDLLDARQEVRNWRKTVKETREAYNTAKSQLSKATARAEEVLTQIEHKQGRLTFEPDSADAHGKRRKATDAGSIAE